MVPWDRATAPDRGCPRGRGTRIPHRALPDTLGRGSGRIIRWGGRRCPRAKESRLTQERTFMMSVVFGGISSLERSCGLGPVKLSRNGGLRPKAWPWPKVPQTGELPDPLLRVLGEGRIDHILTEGGVLHRAQKEFVCRRLVCGCNENTKSEHNSDFYLLVCCLSVVGVRLVGCKFENTVRDGEINSRWFGF